MSDASGAAAPAFASTVGQVLSRSAARSPDRLALTFADRSWTYAELDRAAGRVAAALLAQGLTPGDRVAAFGHNSDAYLLLYLGCAKAGLVHVPVNFNARRDELVYLLTQSEPRIAFVDPSLAEHVDAIADRLGGVRCGTLRDGDLGGDSTCWRWATDPGGADPRGARRPRHRPRAAALHVGHDLAGQGRDADPPSARARVRLGDRGVRAVRSATRRCTRCRSITPRSCTAS